MSGFHGDGRISFHSRAVHCAGRSVDAAQNVNGEDILPAFTTAAVEPANRVARDRGLVARESRAVARERRRAVIDDSDEPSRARGDGFLSVTPGTIS
jgi:hypothetical protein